MLARHMLRWYGQGGARTWTVAASARRKRSSVAHHQGKAVTATDRILRSHIDDIIIPDVTIPEVIWGNLAKWPEHTATVCSATGRSYTYAELRGKSLNFAKSLRAKLGLKRGSCIAVLLPNVPEYPIALLGAMEAGIVVTTVNPIYTPDEIIRQLIDADAKAVVTLCDLYSTVKTAVNMFGAPLPVVTIKTKQMQATPSGCADFMELCDKPVPADDIGWGSPDDIAIMPYSSGTTGLPKGVELTHRNIVANLLQTMEFNDVIMQETNATNQDVVPCVLPMFHIYGMTINTFKILCSGAKIVTMSRFTPDSYIEMLEKHHPDHLFVVPPIVIFLAGHPSVKSSHLESVRCLMTGAAPLGVTDVERFFQKANKEIITIQGYGMTETSPGITMAIPNMWKECLGSIGVCLPNTECKVVSVDDSSVMLGPNEKGELYVKGPQVMPRYHNNPKATEEVFDDGWLRTGDMVYYDDKNIVWITDRLKELIKVKGFQVAPAELEALIRNHPDVADAAVIGVPHPLSGEVPKAYVVPKAGVKLNTKDLQDYVAKQVASYKKLEGGVTVLDAIPKNPSGKILRRTLKLMFEEEQ